MHFWAYNWGEFAVCKIMPALPVLTVEVHSELF